MKGKRYTPEEKNEILDYVESFNTENGRGGQSSASKKYGISPLTISNWLKARNGGVKPKVKGKKRGRKPGSKNAPKTTASASNSGPMGKKLEKLHTLHDKIESTRNELAKMEKEFDSLKGSL